MRKIGLISVVLVLATLSGCYYFGNCLDGSGPVISELRQIEGFTGVVNSGSFDLFVTRSDEFRVEVKAPENLLAVIETYVSGTTLIVQIEDGVCIRSNNDVEVQVSMPETELLRLTGSGRVFADVVESIEAEVSNSGSGHMAIDSMMAETGLLSNSGSGSVAISYLSMSEADFVQSGSGAILCGTLSGTTEVDLRHSSSGRITVTIPDGRGLDAILSGSGRLELAGAVEVADYSLISSGRLDALELEASEVKAINSGSGNIFLWANDELDATLTGSGDIIFRGDPVINSSITGSGSLRSY